MILGTIFPIGLAGCLGGNDASTRLERPEPTMSLDEAIRLVRQKRHEEAIEALLPYVSMPKPETRALVAYGRALIGVNRHTRAIWSFQRVLERPDAPPDAPHAYGAALVFGGDEFAAIDFATAHLEKEPDDVWMLDIRAQAYEAAMDFERAVEDLEIVQAERPNNPRPLERLLNLLIQIEDWDSARQRMNELREMLVETGAEGDARVSFCVSAAKFEQERGELEAAEAELRGCLEEFPAEPPLVFALEELLDESGRVDEATALIEGLSEAFPKRQLIRQGHAARLARLGRLDEADALLRETAETDGHYNSWLALANLRLSLDDLDGTVEALDRAVEAAMETPADDPGLDWGRMNPPSRFGIGDVYVRAGHFERAERLIASLMEDEPAMALLLRGRMKLEQGDPRGALDDYQEAFVTFPSNPAARYLAGRAAVELGEFDLALDLYQDALRSDPAATDAGLVLAQMLLAEGRINWALDALSFQMSRAGADPKVARVMARAAATGGAHQFAEGLRAEMAKNAQWAGIALAEQARDVAALKGPGKALAYLEQSESLDEPTHYEAFWAWVRLAKMEGREEEARRREAAYHARHADKAAGWIVRGRLHFEDDEPDAAVEALRKAVELNPLDPTIHRELGLALVVAGRVDDGVAELDRAADLDPQDPEAPFHAVMALYDAERYEEATARIDAMLIPHPWHGRAALIAFDIERALGRENSERAYEMARRAARYSKACGPRAHLAYARQALRRGETKTALSAFEKTILAAYDVANARHGAAQALAALGRSEEAIAQLELALSSPELDEPVAARVLLEELESGRAQG